MRDVAVVGLAQQQMKEFDGSPTCVELRIEGLASGLANTTMEFALISSRFRVFSIALTAPFQPSTVKFGLASRDRVSR